MSIWTWMFCPHYMKQLLTCIKCLHRWIIIGTTLWYFSPLWNMPFIIVLSPFFWCMVLWFAFWKRYKKQNLGYLHSYSSLSCSAAHLWKPYSMIWWNLGEISEWERLKLSVTYCDPPPSQDVLWLQKIPYVHIKTSFLITFCRRHRSSCPHR